jgi:hypothetical protein
MRIDIESIQRTGRVHQRRAGIDRDGDTQSLGDFFLGRTVANGRFGVDRDAAVAAQRNRDREGDELAGFRSEAIRLLASGAESEIAFDRLWAELANVLDAGRQLLAILIPVKHHIRALPVACALLRGAPVSTPVRRQLPDTGTPSSCRSPCGRGCGSGTPSVLDFRRRMRSGRGPSSASPERCHEPHPGSAFH